MIQSPATYDPAAEDKYDRLYIDTLIKRLNRSGTLKSTRPLTQTR
jgi:hypothetical protein